MRGVYRSCILGAACVLLVLAGSAPAAAVPMTTFAPAAIVATIPEAVQPAAMGDPPTVPRRRGGRQSKGKDKPYQPLAKDPVGESDAAHKEYLKRYGF